jgi:beta-glucosidase-like glycosyl hydrolase
LKRIFGIIVASLAITTPTHPAYNLKDLTLDEKIGQLFIIAAVADEGCNAEFMETQPYQMDIDYVAHLITTYHVGGIIFLGWGTQAHVNERMAYFQSISKRQLFGCIDAEWGLAMRLADGMQFPRAKMLGAINDPMLVEDMAYHIGMQCKEIGIHCNFAPVADVNNNPANVVIKDRSFGATPEVVIENASAYAKGLHNAGVLGCAKHFPGHGDTNVDSHYDLPRISHHKQRLDQIELAPFASLIQQGIPAVMVAHLEVPALEPQAFLPASLSRALVTDLLRNKMGFKGLIVTDGLGMAGVTKNAQQPGEVELKALLAGNDMLLCPVSLESAVALIKQALATGVLSEKELDEHVQRILDAKEWVFTQKDQQPYDSKKAFEVKEELDRKISEISSAGLQRQAHRHRLRDLKSRMGCFLRLH